MRSTSRILTDLNSKTLEAVKQWSEMLAIYYIHTLIGPEEQSRQSKKYLRCMRYSSSIRIRSEEQNTRHRQSSPRMMKFWRTCDEADNKTDKDDGGSSNGGVPQVGDWVKKVDARPDARQRDQITKSTHLATSPLPLIYTSKKQLMPLFPSQPVQQVVFYPPIS